ncbi:alpha/beta hydrolase [Haloactinomyces albus]|uniref:Pimeloyl-ACP methyl ester carboxylesterase n=1 Tax=Haloactinomyces albus TaxID=1352928 RepID=A0AAE3ZEW1_9ACTN|nr:alpha/beta hydrolase [Haloactinomyces albus]MDR7303666.1 pimeloyl-ACP methyl ester carboxylesterase [Haloactinomyces albus]
MNHIGELKKFASVHSKLLNIPDDLWEEVLDRISHDRDGAPRSWVYEWSSVGDAYRADGDNLAACNCYTMARFPFVDGAARQEALRRAVESFDEWRSNRSEIGRLDLELAEPKGRVRCLTNGLSATRPRPLLLFMGGIVSLKEQWAPLLELADQLGLAMVITEMPGVGENTVRYERDSWRMLPRILDALASHADVARTFAIANSFSGHLALRCAIEEPRIRGVISNAAPISDFFTDVDWRTQLPRVTIDTLAHLLGTSPENLSSELDGWALTPEELAALRIPVAYMASTQDEITPPSEIHHLRDHVHNLRTRVLDDVHASPGHLQETREWLFDSLTRMRQEQQV